MSEEIHYKKYEPLFGSWYIIRKIGKGAVGRVFEIEREDLGITYKAALKIITIPEGPDDITRVLSTGVQEEDLADYYRDVVNQIANEFQYLAQLKGCSYIVNYEDHLIIEDEEEFKWNVLIKTELLTPLVEYAIENPLTESDVVQLGLDICRALSFCGKFNIIHRDIKPENIFIGPSGDFKLGDFGIARVAEETQVNMSRKGTFTYMAPEVFRGKAYGQTADLYSLGIVMYKYLNHGRGPLMPDYPNKIQFDDAENAFSERISGREFPPPSEGSDILKQIVLKACSYDPADRYRSASEMLSDLEDLYVQMARSKNSGKDDLPEPAVPAIHQSAPKISTWARPGDNTDSSGTIPQYISINIRKYKAEGNNSGNKETSAPLNHRGKLLTKFLMMAMAIVVLGGIGAYFLIPREVTDITGVDDYTTLYYDEILNPDYKIEPDWFKNEPISFITTDDDVVTVSEHGVIEAVSIGEADIVMHAKEYTETVHISVVPKVTEIKNIEASYVLTTGSSIDLNPDLEPHDFSEEKITYKSKDKNVVSVDSNGVVTAEKPGTSRITISAGGKEIVTDITVKDPEPLITYNSSNSKKKKSSKSKRSKKSKSSNEYFDSSDDEYF